MAILFGHPCGNPNSHHAALAHFELGRLEAFCVAWMPKASEIRLLRRLPGLADWVARLERRTFPPLENAPLVQGRFAEWARMLQRVLFRALDGERLAYEANDWLMDTMARECNRTTVTAIHSYEDCSLNQFETAKTLGKACVYDMPIGYYPAWQDLENKVAATHRDWLPNRGLSSRRFVRPLQKHREMQLADLVLVPSRFVEQTIHQYSDRKCSVAGYGVDSEFWCPVARTGTSEKLRFIFAGQLTLRKGVHLLFKAWKMANLPEAELLLVGRWDFADHVRSYVSRNIQYIPPCSKLELRELYRSADIFVFPSLFEGFGLVILEAMACGLPVITSESSGVGPELVGDDAGQVIQTGNVDALVDALQNASNRRGQLSVMKQVARAKACQCTWERYRKTVSAAVAPYCR